jgi:predicted kinase
MELVMLCGIPTSGKSTYVKKVKEHCLSDYVVLSTDNYIEEQAKRLGKTYNDVFSDVISDATRELELQLIMAKDKGKNIIWDQTNLSVKSRKNKLSKIPSSYRRIAVYFQVSLGEALERNKHREGKFIPESVLKSMHQQFQIPTLDEGFDIIENGMRTLDPLAYQEFKDLLDAL